jgi:chromate reductase, NAD(P)H dehydrogenase (quinone)
MRVLGISGSLRSESHNSRLVSALGDLVPAGVELVEWDQLRALPHYDQDLEGDVPQPVEEWREALREADAVVIATPEYNSSLPGVLKNALDWASRPYATNPLRNKPVAVIGASTNDYGAMWARADARRILGRIGARVVEQEHGVPQAAAALGDDGLSPDSEHREALAGVLEALVEAAQPHRVAA